MKHRNNDPSSLQADDAARERQCPEDSAARGAGAQASNTAPDNCIPPSSGPVLLTRGIDSLYLSFTGRLFGDVERRLDHAKECAQKDDWESQALAAISVAGQVFTVLPYGRGKFQFVIRSEAFTIQLSNRKNSKLPVCYCQVSSAALLVAGATETCAQLIAVVEKLIEREDPPTISRCDFYVDAVEPFDLSAVPLDAWVCRARERNQYAQGQHCTGFTFGAGGDISARVYDKPVEIAKSRKDYLRPIWQRLGWSEGQTVIRVEFQLNSKVLRELGIRSIVDLDENASGAWHYCASEWLRLTEPSASDSKQTRWPTHPGWDLLSRTTYSGEAVLRRATLPNTQAPRDQSIFSSYVGCLSSWMAKSNQTDPLEAHNDLYLKCEAHHQGWAEYRDEDFEGHIHKRAALKARQWCMTFGDWQEKAEREFLKAEADAYRRAKKKGS